MKKIRQTLWRTALAIPVMTASVPALSQVMLSDPGQIAACLCQERLITAKGRLMAVRQGALDAMQSRVNGLSADIEAERGTINTADPIAVQTLRDRIEQRDALREEMGRSVYPDFQDSIEDYNRAVGDFTARCGGKTYELSVLNQIQPALNCPAVE